MSVTDDVKERLDIVEVIQSYVPLKKAGRNFKGLCPFHSEKTPSFVVFPDSGTWHCFGACATGGDLFSFVMKRENIGFTEALDVLARRAGIELKPPSPQASEAEKRLALLREINQVAAAYFHHLLINSDEAAAARAYLDRRGLNRETLERFQVGYALDQWDALLRYLTSKRYAPADIAEAGLIVPRDDRSGYYDRFRGRILFAIRDPQGHTVGFGGRVLGDGVPKYLNSPQSPAFDKGSLLYGLDQAKQGIRLTGEAVIVEGYMDVLMAHQHGINNVVAQMGTALTEPQLKHLKRHAQRLVLALDSDAAGDQATLRGLEVVRQVADREVVPVPTPQGLIQFEERLAVELRIAALPPGMDPDEVIRQSPARWAQLIAQAKPVMEFYFVALTAGLDLSAARDKAEAVRALGPIIAELGDRVQRAHYLQQLGRMVQVDERTLWQQIRQQAGGKQPVRRARPEPAAGTRGRAQPGLEEHCLAIFLSHPDLLERADAELQASGDAAFDAEDLARPEDRALLGAWRRWLAEGGQDKALTEFFTTLDETLQARASVLLASQEGQPPVADELLRKQIVGDVTRLRLRNLQRRNQELRFLYEDAQASGDSEAHKRFGRLNTEVSARIRRLEQATKERSVIVRRQRADAAVRAPFSEE